MSKEQAQKTEEQTESQNPSTEAANTDEPAPKGSPLKLILMIVGPLLLIGIIVGALFFLGILGGSKEGEVKEEKHEESLAEQMHDVFTYNLPSMLINLRTTGRRTSFLKVTFVLEVKGNEEAKKELELLKPRIVDQFQTYLRELEVDDLQGSAGMQRLKEELLDRVNAVTAPIKVQNVLFSEFLVQ